MTVCWLVSWFIGWLVVWSVIISRKDWKATLPSLLSEHWVSFKLSFLIGNMVVLRKMANSKTLSDLRFFKAGICVHRYLKSVVNTEHILQEPETYYLTTNICPHD